MYMAVEVALGEGLLNSLIHQELAKILFYMATTAIATSVIALPLHRRIILDESKFLPTRISSTLTFAVVEFLMSLVVAIGIGFLFLPLGLSSMLDGYVNVPNHMVAIAVGVFLILVAIFASAHVATLLPHIAVSSVDRFRPKFAIGLASGHRIEIIVRFFRVSVLLGLVKLGGRGLLLKFENMLPSNETLAGYYLPILLDTLWYLCSALIFVTLASFIYVRLTGEPEYPHSATSDETES